MLGERAQVKTTLPPTLEKETKGVNPQRAVSEDPGLDAHSEETARTPIQVRKEKGRGD
jgi:hypothetical protein